MGSRTRCPDPALPPLLIDPLELLQGQCSNKVLPGYATAHVTSPELSTLVHQILLLIVLMMVVLLMIVIAVVTITIVKVTNVSALVKIGGGKWVFLIVIW